jgi:hypothetical protein
MKWDPHAEYAIWQTYCEQDQAPSYHAFARFIKEQCQEKEKKALFQAELKLLRDHAKLKKGSKVSWNLYYFLCVAGGIYALCSGFDGMVSVLSLLAPQIYLGVLIAFGLLSALSALGIFIARDRPSISDSLDLEHDPYHSMVDEYLYHVQMFNNQAIEDKWRPNPDIAREYETAQKLKQIFKDKKKLNCEKKSSIWVGLQSQLVMGIGAVLFFSDGFFVGENVALLLAPLLGPHVAAITLGLSIAMGLFALAAYWYVERSSLKDYLFNHVVTDEYLREEHAQKNKSNLKKISIFQPANPREDSPLENLVYA